MENEEIAKVFEDIINLLEIKGENHFRVRSYRNAFDIILETPERIERLALADEEDNGGRVESIPGIGKSIAEKIHEIVHTGGCKLRSELLEEFPAGLLDILKISGVGPKKAAAFYRELDVTDVDSLEKALMKGKARELPGMGQKTEEKLLKAIENLRSFTDRFTLSEALPHAAAIIELLAGIKGVTKAVPAGSLRRWKETVGDIDILVTCKDPAPVFEAFTTYETVREIVSKGGTKASVILKNGLQADLRVVKAEEFGSALHYFTGSKGHNVALRERAKKMGLKINEYGVFDEKSEKRIAGKTEEELYAAIGLEWMAPELRENAGEIEAAEKGTLPKLIEAKDIKGDLHMHTTASDGAASIEEMANAAIARGYKYIAITDHSHATGIANGLDEARLLKHIKGIDAVNKKLKKEGSDFVILKGAEVDILASGKLDYSKEVLEKLDCVVGAVHSGFTQKEEVMTARIIKAIESGLIHIVAHPTGRLIGARAPYDMDMDEVLKAAKANNVVMELNCFPRRLDLKDTDLKLAKEYGVLIAISTDAHGPEGLNNIHFGVHTARRAWLTKKDVLNTKGITGLLKLLKKEG